MHTEQRSLRLLVPFVPVLCLILLMACTALGQSSNGSIRGTVRDQTGAVIPGAKLELINKATNTVLRTETNEAGLYAFPSVISGEYTLTVTFAGMEPSQVALRVQVQASTNFDAVLRPGGTEAKITVSSDVVPLATTDSGTLGHVLER